MKSKCIKKPFDNLAWCGRDTRCDLVAYNLDSLLLNLIHKKEMDLCPICIAQLHAIIHIKNNSMMRKLNEA